VEVGVHIADVTYFVSHNSPLDREAQQRGTTFYLVDRRFDMLPSLLSSDLCSLHGGVDRLAVSVIWTMSCDLETVKSVWYGRTVIHNCQAMTYDQAHNILHDKAPDEPGKLRPPPLTAGYPVDLAKVPQLKKDLTILRDLGRRLKRNREAVGGAVDLSSGDLGGELKFTLDKDGNPVAVKPKKELVRP
jgi:DIS3-like exonuclease 1